MQRRHQWLWSRLSPSPTCARDGCCRIRDDCVEAKSRFTVPLMVIISAMRSGNGSVSSAFSEAFAQKVRSESFRAGVRY